MAGRTQKTVPWVALVIAVAAPFFSWLEAREARMQVRESRTDGSAGYHLLLREVDQLHQRLDALEGREPTVAIETSDPPDRANDVKTAAKPSLPPRPKPRLLPKSPQRARQYLDERGVNYK
jgi:hypothetical protein